MIRWLWAVTLVFAIACPGSRAATVDNLQSARVPVADASDAELGRGLAAALQIVVVKLTGHSATAQTGEVRALLRRARQLNTVFGYEHDSGGALWLRAEFDLGAVRTALREAGVTVWGSARPELLAWLVVDDGTGRQFGPTPTTQTLYDALDRQAANRGIPLRQPVPDAAFATMADPDELATALLSATAAYGTPATLIALVQQAPEQHWTARWWLQVEGETTEWTSEGELPEPLVTSGVDRGADALVEHYMAATATGAAQSVALTVDGIVNADDYGRAINYLASLDMVTHLAVSRVEGRTVVFELATRSGPAALAQAIGFGSVLRPAAQPGTYTLNP